jgi:hypothetical protein
MIDLDAWLTRKLLVGHSLNGELRDASESIRSLLEYMGSFSEAKTRDVAWQAYLCGRPDRDALIKAVAEADPLGPAPDAETMERCATLEDLRRLVANEEWIWPGWMARGVLNGLAADPGTGKTIMTTDLARRFWFKEDMPDGQPNPLPEKTRTLWVPGDRHYMQLLGLAEKFGLPDNALIFNAPASDPTAGLDLDDPAELAALARRIRAESPGVVIVDTVGMTTGKNLCRPEDARDYFGPLMDLARDTGVAFLLLTHLSKDGQALGRRINGACRLVWKITAPDPDGQPDRRRVWVDKTFAEKPPALGMTIASTGCVFDFKPPVAPSPAPVGRPASERSKAEQFIKDALSSEDGQLYNDLMAAWGKSGGGDSTFRRAMNDMLDAGTLRKTGGTGTREQMRLYLNGLRKIDSDPDMPY